jgi:RNA polymerase sigma-70 factor, ECF subfamily
VLRQVCLREAGRLLLVRDEAEEAVQEALLRAWRASPDGDGIDSPVAWALQITRNEAFRLMERQRRLRAREVPEEDHSVEPVHEDPRLDEIISAAATAQAVAALDPEEKELVGLRYVRDLSQPEVARYLDLPEGTVKARLHRIRGRLRQALEER